MRIGTVREIEPALEEAIQTIKQFEWLHLTSYLDFAQRSIWFWTKSFKWETITKEEAEKRLLQEVENRWHFVKDLKATNSQKASLISYIYNTWNTKILPYAKRWDWKSVKYIMNKYIYCWWKVCWWLVKRRMVEVAMLTN